jgi:hypothetical protein
MVEGFRDGGWGMYPILVFGLILIAAAIRYAVRPRQRLVPLLFGLGILTLASGALGFVTDLITVAHAIEKNPEFTARAGFISIIGVGESLNTVAFALVFVTLAALVSCLGAFQIARTKNDEPENA